jgi:spore maturation protein CgeB
MKLLIVGYSEPGQMGNYLASAALRLGLDYQIMDAGRAEATSRIVKAFYWRLRRKRPAKLTRFASQVVEACAVMRPTVVLTTGGRAALEREHIEKLQTFGIKVINYSTDDPWNPVFYAPWFLSTLPAYDAIFTPRRANVEEFRRWNVRGLHYLPFAYDAQVHRPWPANLPAGAPSDVLFVGGCDAERLPLISALADADLKLALFGRYWNAHSKTRSYWRGVADQGTIRAASASAGISLCLVRRANRDGHVMRSYEAAAIGGCVLAEDTPDHRELFGPEDRAAQYFTTISELVQKARILTADVDARRRLSLELRQRMSVRTDTYSDRLAEMLRLSASNELQSRTVVPAQ